MQWDLVEVVDDHLSFSQRGAELLRVAGEMTKHLTDQIIAKLPRPATGNKIYYDAPNSRGAGLRRLATAFRVTAAGAKAFVLTYGSAKDRTLAHRLTIGGYPTWSLTAARAEDC